MLYGLYQSAAGADLQALKMDIVSNNIANAGTSTFKRDLAVFSLRQQQAETDGNAEDVPPHLQGHPGNAVLVETHTDHSQGPLKLTGSPLDVALMGPGFFQITNGREEYLTRRGSFTLNADSELVEVDTGNHVLDQQGDIISVPPGSEIQINDDGQIIANDPITKLNIPVAAIGIVQVNDYQSLQKQGDSNFSTPEDNIEPAGPDVRVRQGYQEQSGVKPVQEMLAMIQTSKAFEANMNLIQHQDHTLGQLLQAVGRN